MLNYKDVVIAENRHKVYLCVLKSMDYALLIVAEDDGIEEYALFNYKDSNDSKTYKENDVLEIHNEVEPDLQDDVSEDDDYEHGIKIDEESLKPFLTSVSDVYSYNSLEELDKIIKALDEPIVCNTDFDNDYRKGLTNHCGLVFFWAEYDDFSCGNPFTPYCKIIDGGSLS